MAITRVPRPERRVTLVRAAVSLGAVKRTFLMISAKKLIFLAKLKEYDVGAPGSARPQDAHLLPTAPMYPHPRQRPNCQAQPQPAR